MTKLEDISCKELVELVTEYLEGSLSETDRERFETHLSMCEGCAQFLRQFERTIQLTGMLKEESVSDAAANKLLPAFRGWKSSRT
jgi:anti-sigma factor RsiW